MSDERKKHIPRPGKQPQDRSPDDAPDDQAEAAKQAETRRDAGRGRSDRAEDAEETDS